MFPVAMDGRDQQAFEEAYRDYPESDWYTMTHCAAFYQRVESAEMRNSKTPRMSLKLVRRTTSIETTQVKP
jgi:hypothetical protein